MTQEDVRRLLDELGGKATVEEISTRAKEKYNLPPGIHSFDSA